MHQAPSIVHKKLFINICNSLISKGRGRMKTFSTKVCFVDVRQDVIAWALKVHILAFSKAWLCQVCLCRSFAWWILGGRDAHEGKSYTTGYIGGFLGKAAGEEKSLPAWGCPEHYGEEPSPRKGKARTLPERGGWHVWVMPLAGMVDSLWVRRLLKGSSSLKSHNHKAPSSKGPAKAGYSFSGNEKRGWRSACLGYFKNNWMYENLNLMPARLGANESQQAAMTWATQRSKAKSHPQFIYVTACHSTLKRRSSI